MKPNLCASISSGLLIIILFSACSEDNITLSDSEILGQELQKVITENKIEKVIPYKWDILIGKEEYEWVFFLGNVTYRTYANGLREWTFTYFESDDFEIQRNVIRIKRYYIPLNKLAYYSVIDGKLHLYFEDLR
jgi:hypothetical protein